MPAPTQCTISGTINNLGGDPVSGATISVSSIKPFIHTADNSLIANYSVSATTNGSGAFSLDVVETTTVSVSLLLTIAYPLSSAGNKVISAYYVTIPNSASATLASLISGQ